MSHLGVVSYVIPASWQSGEHGQLILSLSPYKKHKSLRNLCYCRDRMSERPISSTGRHNSLGKPGSFRIVFMEQLFYAVSLLICKEFLVHISSTKNVLRNSLWQSNVLQIQNINCTGKWCNICFPKSMRLSSINDHISCLRISEMQSNWFTMFICLNDYSHWWLSTLLIHITVVVLPFCCLTQPDILMYFASSLSHSSAAQGLWLMTTYSSQATGLHLSLHPFLFFTPPPSSQALPSPYWHLC